jgi:ABC-type transport system involved in multi-copper enzyme maturation permease subunit
MLCNIAWFEIRYWLRSWMLWIFTLVIAAMIFGAVSSDQVQVGGALSNTFRNAPFVIQNFYALVGILTLLFCTAFVNSAASRDFSHNTYQIVFSTPISRRDYLFGHFFGATLVSIIPMLGVSLGILLAQYMPWVEPERWGPVYWGAHLKGILLFAVPNAFFVAAVMFTVAVLARNDLTSFATALVFITGYAVSQSLLQNLERERLAALLDPFAMSTFALATKYWTVAEKNTLAIGASGPLLWNRLLWLAVGGAFLAFAYFRFSFAERRSRVRRVHDGAATLGPVVAPTVTPIPAASVTLSEAPWSKFWVSVRVHLLGILKSTVFVIILLAALLNCVHSIISGAREAYGSSTLPVTYWILEIISGTLYVPILAIITFYAGVLVWKDRDRRIDEIVDSLPTPEWVAYLSRLAALVVTALLVQLLALGSGVVVQASYGYHRFQLGLYLEHLIVRDGSFFLFFGVLAFFIHVLSPNKYLGYFLFIAFAIANSFIWDPLNVATNLVQFGTAPNVTYSDLFGDAPYITAWRWFTLYWVLFSGLLAIATIMLWPRGRETGWRDRWRNARLRFRRPWPAPTLGCLLAFAATGGWIYYNTEVLNTLLGPKDLERRQADYEKSYKRFEKLPQPRVRSVKYYIDIFPASRNMLMRGEEVIQNPYPRPLSEVHFTLNYDYDTTIAIPGAVLTKDDTRLNYRIYRFTTPLQPGESRIMTFTVKSHNRGFENSVSANELVQNGTFFNNMVGPVIGYVPVGEIHDPNERRKCGLGEQELMPALERNCTDDCRDHYIPGHAEWVDLDTVISTSPDQIAIAPGSLVREWQQNGRRYFEYKLDHPSLFYFSFLSARYEVLREDWNRIKLEVYYHRDHPWNVPRMMNALKKSLAYYTQNFGPYYHKEARIVEFPRVGTFAQAYAGTMPYSESVGFIANLNHPDDIDMVSYVVAHEVAHQWWAQQVVGANMQGATLLSESLAQYSALMVMEKEYGRDMMRKFLRYEMDEYLRSRGREQLKERPLLTVEMEQGYIHYRKASVVLYYLKEMIGEEKVNAALRKLIRQYSYNAPPYPTSWALVDALSEQTPPQYQYLLKDLFEDITLFSNRTLEATARRRPDGKYDVTLNIETHKFKADAKGNETEVPVNDWIDIGAFAKPENDRKYGRTLYRDRVHIAQTRSTCTFTVGELPDQAGVDPFLLLIDRIPDDNTKKVSLVNTSPVSADPVHRECRPAP